MILTFNDKPEQCHARN